MCRTWVSVSSLIPHGLDWPLNASSALSASAELLVFTRATLCLARSLLSSRVCLSLTRRYCVHTAKRILKLFWPSGSQWLQWSCEAGAHLIGGLSPPTPLTLITAGSPIILVFFYSLRRYLIPRNPSAGALNTRGVWKLAIFDWNRRLSRKRYEIVPWRYYVTLIVSHRWWIDQCQFRWPWVTSDPDFKVTTFFEVKYLKNGAF